MTIRPAHTCLILGLVLLVACFLIVPATAHAQCTGEVLSHQKISEHFGVDVESLGRDPDGDGPIADVVAVVAEFDSDGGFRNGAVYILFLDDQGMVLSHNKMGSFTGPQDCHPVEGRCTFVGVTWLGNLDGLGGDDLAVGTIGDDDGSEDSGAVWILFLNTDFTLASQQKISAADGLQLTTGDRLGSDTTWLGDLGVDAPTPHALAVGALGPFVGTAPAGSTPGAVWILFLNDDGTLNDWVKIGDGTGGFTGALDTLDHFGEGVASLGDLDGDGITDLAVSAALDDDGGNETCLLAEPFPNCERGAVWILFLNSDGTVREHQKISDTTGGFDGELGNNDRFGGKLAWLGDMGPCAPSRNALAVGAHRDDDGGFDHGAVWILFLEDDGTVTSHRKISDTEGLFDGILDNGDQFGSAAWLGDLNGDGIGDLAVGARGDDDGGVGPCLDPFIPNCDRGATWILFLNALLWLDLDKDTLSWGPPGAAQFYQVIGGDLGLLRSSKGDFSQATMECLVPLSPDNSLFYPVDPDVGEGFWFLARRRTTAGNETYDTCGLGQAEPRDPEIAASGVDCP
jgi:hypothetical protein